VVGADSRKRGFLVLNQHWFVLELRKRGHDVTSAGFYNKAFDLNIEQSVISIEDLLSHVSHPVDTILFHDDSGLPRILGLESCSLTKVFLSVDAHHHHQWHCALAALFDLVLVAQKNYLEKFSYSSNKHWFPVWAQLEAEFLPMKDHEVVFRGTMNPKFHPKRKIFFDELASLVPVDAVEGDYFEIYRRAKIVINQAVSDDLNFRVFEAMACGALLITPSGTVGLDSLFRDGRELVIYERDNVAEAAEKVRYYLDHDEERERIARAGWQLVCESHSNRARVDKLLELLEQTRQSTTPLPIVAHDLAARVAIFSFVAHRAAKAEASEQLLDSASVSLSKALLGKCILSDEDLGAMIFMLTDLLREFKREGDCLELLRTAREARPNQLTLALLYMEQLLNSGMEAEAQKLARELSDSPEELIVAAPRLLADVRKERATWIGKPAANEPS
jgi:hypothetical protein